jgi:pilus assembly protein Flp/PilA
MYLLYIGAILEPEIHPSALIESQAKGGDTAMLYMPREEGQGLVEYALILVLVAVVVIAILTLLGPAVGNVFSTIMNAI